MLPRRLLSFTNYGLEWRCLEAVSEEQSHRISKPLGTYRHYNVTRADTRWPNLKKWDNFLRSYLERELTYETDVLRAFKGIETALGDGMSGGFHFGLSEQFFDAALLWVPQEHLTLRGDAGEGFSNTPFTSWSWAGWKGKIQNQINAFGLGHERSNVIMDYRARKVDVFPLVKW